MYQPQEIANYFIQLSHRTGEELTPMKLIKLCYIAHGWHLGLYNKELIAEVVYAWKFGPVIQSLYRQFKKYGNSQITELARESDCEDCYPIASEEIRPFLNKIWEVYKGYDGIQLSTLTHQPGTPWDTVWNHKKGKDELYAIIPNEIIEQHYKSKIQQANGKRTAEYA